LFLTSSPAVAAGQRSRGNNTRLGGAPHSDRKVLGQPRWKSGWQTSPGQEWSKDGEPCSQRTPGGPVAKHSERVWH